MTVDSKYAALEVRVKELEDIREINDVFFKWHHDCTGGFNGKQAGRMEALEVLTDDATIEVQALHEPGKGPRGREEVTKFWEYYYGDAGPLPYVFQTSVDNRVTVTGDTAIQESNMLIFTQVREMAPYVMISQRTNDFVRTPKGWKIKKTTVGAGFWVTINQLNGPLNKLPPAEKREEWKPKGK